MASYSEIERVARRGNEALYELQRKRDSFSREVYYLDSWWLGEPCRAFKEEHQEIIFRINEIFNSIRDLERRLRRLAREVERAEEERRRRLEELRMANTR